MWIWERMFGFRGGVLYDFDVILLFEVLICLIDLISFKYRVFDMM